MELIQDSGSLHIVEAPRAAAGHGEFLDRIHQLIHQGGEERAIEETLDTGWRVLGGIPEVEYRRIRKEMIERYHRQPPLPGPAPQPAARGT